MGLSREPGGSSSMFIKGVSESSREDKWRCKHSMHSPR